jgi:hypothetical protein
MTDFGPLIANPSTILLGAAAQFGVYVAMLGAIMLGFPITAASAIGIIGGADGPTSIYMASKMAPEYLGAIAVASYSYMSLVPLIQPPIIKLLTKPADRRIIMAQLRPVSRIEKIIFPIATTLLVSLLLPPVTLLGHDAQLMRESLVVNRLSDTAQCDDQHRHDLSRPDGWRTKGANTSAAYHTQDHVLIQGVRLGTAGVTKISLCRLSGEDQSRSPGQRISGAYGCPRGPCPRRRRIHEFRCMPWGQTVSVIGTPSRPVFFASCGATEEGGRCRSSNYTTSKRSHSPTASSARSTGRAVGVHPGVSFTRILPHRHPNEQIGPVEDGEMSTPSANTRWFPRHGLVIPPNTTHSPWSRIRRPASDVFTPR